MDTNITPVMEEEHPLDRAARLYGSRELLAKELGVTPSAYGNWKQSGVVPEKRCVRIEKLLNRRVTREQLRPADWWEIWPELANAESGAQTCDSA